MIWIRVLEWFGEVFFLKGTSRRGQERRREKRRGWWWWGEEMMEGSWIWVEMCWKWKWKWWRWENKAWIYSFRLNFKKKIIEKIVVLLCVQNEQKNDRLPNSILWQFQMCVCVCESLRQLQYWLILCVSVCVCRASRRLSLGSLSRGPRGSRWPGEERTDEERQF